MVYYCLSCSGNYITININKMVALLNWARFKTMILDDKKSFNLINKLKKYNKSKALKKELTINDINSMDFKEIKNYFESKIKNGLNIKDLQKELLTLWDDGIINGLTYRFIIEAFECDLDIDFIDKAKLYGRYYY